MKNILILFAIIIIVVGCKKEDPIIPMGADAISGYEFPEGTPYDDITKRIFDEFDTQIIWKNLRSEDLNKVWTGSGISSGITALRATEEQAGEAINFLDECIFSKLDKDLFQKVMKQYVYIAYDAHKLVFGSFLMPVEREYDGINNWLFSLWGDEYKYTLYTPHHFPKTDEEFFLYRFKFFGSMFSELIKELGIIEVPPLFRTDFVYGSGYKVDPAHEKFFMKAGFCGKFNSFSGALGNVYSMTLYDNFLSYVMLVAMYSREEIQTTAGMGNNLYKDYPLILEWYDYVDNYMIENYNYDLKQLHVK